MSKVIMGNGGFYRCLSEPQGFFSVMEGSSTNTYSFFSYLLLNRLEPQSSKVNLLLPIMPMGIVAYAFTLVGQPLSKQLYSHRKLFTVTFPN